MGTYFNQSNRSYCQAVNSRIYIDKTPIKSEESQEFLALYNENVDDKEKCS